MHFVCERGREREVGGGRVNRDRVGKDFKLTFKCSYVRNFELLFLVVSKVVGII